MPKLKLPIEILGLFFEHLHIRQRNLFEPLQKSLFVLVWSRLHRCGPQCIKRQNCHRKCSKTSNKTGKECGSSAIQRQTSHPSLPSLEYRRERADVIQVYKILHNIDKVNKSKLFTLSDYTSTRGNSLKLFKRRSRLQIRANSFSNRVVDVWNSLSDSVVQAPSLNCFKSRLNSWWHDHPNKFDPACYVPDQTIRRQYPNASGTGRNA